MGKGHYFWERLTEETDFSEGSLPGQSIIEIAGDRRVLIENHLGIKMYGCERIVVKMKFGTICVCGAGLEMARMSREQLVIRGRIDGVNLQRRR